jgi:hypothetical protein
LRVEGSGFRVWGVGVGGLGFGVWGLGDISINPSPETDDALKVPHRQISRKRGEHVLIEAESVDKRCSIKTLATTTILYKSTQCE